MFRFQLQSILDIKKAELDAAETKERYLRNEIAGVEKKMHGFRDAYINEREALNLRLAESNLRERKILEASLERNKEQIMECLRALAVLRELLAEASRLALALRKKTAGLERLKEKRRVEYEARQERRLQNEIDARSAQQVWLRKREREVA